MEIFVRKTPTQLTVWDLSPMILLLGASFASLGLILTVFNYSLATLTCNRQSSIPPRCQLVERGLHPPKVTEIPLDSLQQAIVRDKFSGRSRRYELLLLTDTHEIPFPKTSFRGQKEAIAERINAFLQERQKTSLIVSQDARLEGLRAGLYLWLFGWLISLGAANRQCEFLTCKFDAKRGLMTLKQRNLWRAGTSEYALQNLETAVIETSQQTKMTRWGQLIRASQYSIVLVLKSGERLWLTTYETEMLKGKQRIVEYITGKMRTEAKTARQETLAQLARNREIAIWQDAIALSPNNAEAHYHLGITLYRHHRYPEAAKSLQRAKDLFQTAGNAEKAAEVRNFLWQSGLE